jgi:type I restriction enzyme S subunit
MSGYAALTRPTELVFKPTGIAEKEFIYCSFTIPEFKQSLCQLVTGTSNSHQRVKADSVLALTSVIPSSSVLAYIPQQNLT